MSSSRPLSLFAAILININVMLGIGIFINTVELAKRAGAYGCLAYVIVGLMMLPLIISIARLVRIYPDGGFYIYARKEIGPLAGFLSGWGYFTGKLGSGAVVLHTAVRLIQAIIPTLQTIPTLALDAILITLFVALNTLNMRAGTAIQSVFMICKIIPIFFAILVGLFLFQPTHIITAPFDISGIGSSLALALFAIIGFEVACSISNKIENPEVNAPKVIIISYGIVITILFLYQIIFFGALGPLLATSSNYLEVYPGLLHLLFSGSTTVALILTKIIHLSFAASALGGSYGTIFSNGWNLFVLAQNGHVFFGSVFTWVNRHAIPVACFITEGIILMSYLLISNGNQVPLQQLGVVGCVFAYTLSVLSLLIGIWRRKYTFSFWTACLGLANCILLIGAAVYGMSTSGPAALILFLSLLAFGAIMFWIKGRQSHAVTQ